MKKQTKKWIKTTAAAVFGAAVCCAGASLSASADASLDPETGTLTLSGNVNSREVRAFANDSSVTKIVCERGTVLPASCFDLFAGSCAESIDLSLADSSAVTNTCGMFRECVNLAQLNITTLDTSDVTDMGGMFYGCKELTVLDLTSFDTSNVLYMSDSETDVPLIEGVDIPPVYYGMFEGCVKLKTISASEMWNSDAVVLSTNMFLGCTALTGGKGTVYDAAKTDKTLACIDTADRAGYFTAPFTGVSVDLTYDLMLKFYVSMTAADSWNDVMVVFTGKCAEAGDEIRFYAKPEGSFARTNISADHMDEPIKADLYRRISGEWHHMDTVTYSINDYLDNAKPEENWSPEKKNAFEKLVSATRIYGQVAKAYFGNGDMSGINVPVHTLGELQIMQEEKNKTIEPEFSSSEATLSLVLNSSMNLRLYINGLQVGDQSSNGRAIAGKDGRACFEITHYSPLRLDGSPVVRYNDVLYRFTPLSWCWRALANDGGDPKNTAMACILYEYWLDAQAFAYAPNT